jgi:hypothetical protein
MPIDVPPFPPLTHVDSDNWACEFVSPAWQTFHGRPCKISLLVYAADDGLPNARQGDAFQYLLDHDKPLADLILTAVMRERPWSARTAYDFAEASQLRGRMWPTFVVVHDVYREWPAYVGLVFHCGWEPNHDLGVLLHRDRIVEFGDAETAIDSWAANRDREERLA